MKIVQIRTVAELDAAIEAGVRLEMTAYGCPLEPKQDTGYWTLMERPDAMRPYLIGGDVPKHTYARMFANDHYKIRAFYPED